MLWRAVTQRVWFVFVCVRVCTCTLEYRCLVCRSVSYLIFGLVVSLSPRSSSHPRIACSCTFSPCRRSSKVQRQLIESGVPGLRCSALSPTTSAKCWSRLRPALPSTPLERIRSHKRHQAPGTSSERAGQHWRSAQMRSSQKPTRNISASRRVCLAF
jgi:hypothetical protein